MGISVLLHYRRLSVHLYLWQLLLWITFLLGHSLHPILTYFSSFVFLHSVTDPGRFASREKESNKWDAGVWQAKWDGQNSGLWCWISCQGPARCPLTTSGIWDFVISRVWMIVLFGRCLAQLSFSFNVFVPTPASITCSTGPAICRLYGQIALKLGWLKRPEGEKES